MTPSITTSVITGDPLIVRKNGRRINAAGMTFQSDPATFRAGSPARGTVAEVVDDVNMLLRREIDRLVADALVRDAAERANRFPYSGNAHRDFITVRDAVQDERTQGVLNPIVADAEARAERARKARQAAERSR